MQVPVELLLVNVEIRYRTPEVPPPLGQPARLNHLPGLQEGRDGMDEAVRQGAQPVPKGAGVAACTGPLPVPSSSIEFAAQCISSVEQRLEAGGVYTKSALLSLSFLRGQSPSFHSHRKKTQSVFLSLPGYSPFPIPQEKHNISLLNKKCTPHSHYHSKYAKSASFFTPFPSSQNINKIPLRLKDEMQYWIRADARFQEIVRHSCIIIDLIQRSQQGFNGSKTCGRGRKREDGSSWKGLRPTTYPWTRESSVKTQPRLTVSPEKARPCEERRRSKRKKLKLNPLSRLAQKARKKNKLTKMWYHVADTTGLSPFTIFITAPLPLHRDVSQLSQENEGFLSEFKCFLWKSYKILAKFLRIKQALGSIWDN